MTQRGTQELSVPFICYHLLVQASSHVGSHALKALKVAPVPVGSDDLKNKQTLEDELLPLEEKQHAIPIKQVLDRSIRQ
jgi:hypothetical protein